MFVVLLKTLVFSLYYFLWFSFGSTDGYPHKDYVIKCFVGTHYTPPVKQRYKFEWLRKIHNHTHKTVSISN